MTPRHFTLSTLVLLAFLPAFVASAPALAAETYGRSYELHTLDYRIAESLVWGICEQHGGKSARCMVQEARPGSLTVFASQKVHAAVVDVLVERDRRVPASLLFEIVLIRLAEDNPDEPAPRAGLADTPHLRKAIDALLELFPGRHPEILDTGLIRTTTRGSTRIGDHTAGFFDATLGLRSTVLGERGLEFTVDLRIEQAAEHGDTRLLSSTLTLAEGETVVAGSSRVGGQPAIVVLLTSK